MFVLLVGALLLGWQLRRARLIRAELNRSAAKESQLRAANARLKIEIEERRAAQASLQKTQSQLERAGRLAVGVARICGVFPVADRAMLQGREGRTRLRSLRSAWLAIDSPSHDPDSGESPVPESDAKAVDDERTRGRKGRRFFPPALPTMIAPRIRWKA